MIECRMQNKSRLMNKGQKNIKNHMKRENLGNNSAILFYFSKYFSLTFSQKFKAPFFYIVKFVELVIAIFIIKTSVHTCRSGRI